MADRKTHEGVTYLKVAALQDSEGNYLCELCVFESDDGSPCRSKFRRIFGIDCITPIRIALPETDFPKYLARKLTQ